MPCSLISIVGPFKINSMAGSSSNLIGDANYAEITQIKEYRSASVNTGDASPLLAPVTPIYNDPHIM
jgi:hypothetical protein